MNRYTRNIICVELEESEASRARSAAVFGNRYFAEVVMAVSHLSGDSHVGVTMRMVASEASLSDSLVRQVMNRLRDAGLVRELPRTGGVRSPRYFQVSPSPLWIGVLRACAAARQSGEVAPADS